MEVIDLISVGSFGTDDHFAPSSNKFYFLGLLLMGLVGLAARGRRWRESRGLSKI